MCSKYERFAALILVQPNTQKDRIRLGQTTATRT